MNLPLHQDKLMLLAWDMHHFGSRHSMLNYLCTTWCCHPFSLLTELVRPMVRSRVILPLEFGAWPGPYDPHLQMPLVDDGVVALWALYHLYQWCATPGLSCQSHSSNK